MSPLLFIVCILLLSMVLRKMEAGNILWKNKRPINHLMFIDDLMLAGAYSGQVNSLIYFVQISSQDFQIAFGIEKCAVIEVRGDCTVDGLCVQFPNDELTIEVNGTGLQVY